MIAAIPRSASMVLVPVTSFAGYATYVRSNAKPAEAHAGFANNHKEWKKFNKGLALNDVGRSGGGL